MEDTYGLTMRGLVSASQRTRCLTAYEPPWLQIGYDWKTGWIHTKFQDNDELDEGGDIVPICIAKSPMTEQQIADAVAMRWADICQRSQEKMHIISVPGRS